VHHPTGYLRAAHWATVAGEVTFFIHHTIGDDGLDGPRCPCEVRRESRRCQFMSELRQRLTLSPADPSYEMSCRSPCRSTNAPLPSWCRLVHPGAGWHFGTATAIAVACLDTSV
jgi:hypothetical protein